MNCAWVLIAAQLFLSLLIPAMGRAEATFQQEIDSLSALLTHTSESIRKVDLLNELSYAYRRLMPDKVLAYADEAESLAIKLDYAKGLATANKNKGIAYYKKGAKKDTVISYYQKAMDIAAEIGDYYTVAACNNNIALTYNWHTEYNLSIEYFLEGIKIFDTHFKEEMPLKALMICNLSYCYYRLHDYDKAYKYIRRGQEMAKRNGYIRIRSMYQDDLGLILVARGQLEEAEKAFVEGMALQEQIGDFQSRLQTLNNLVDLKIDQNALGQAEDFAQMALEQAKQGDYPAMLVQAYTQLGRIYNGRKEYAKVIEFANQAIEKAEDMQSLMHQKDAYEQLYTAYIGMQDFGKAVDVMESLQPINNKINEIERSKITAQLEKEYESQVQSSQIRLLNMEKDNREHQIRQLLIFSIFSIGALLSILFLLIKRNQSAKIINEKNAELKRYIDYNLQLENFAYVASHDLKTPLRTITSFAQLLERSSRDRLKKEEEEYFDFIIGGTKEMSYLIDDLLQYSKVQQSDLNLEQIELQGLIKSVMLQMDTLLKEKNVQIFLNLEVRHIRADRIKLRQVLQNLLVNAIKFSKPDIAPQIGIHCWATDQSFCFEIKDNGIGIEEAYFEKIFLVFKRLHGKGTYEGSGIGLAICKKIVEKHEGTIWVSSQIGQGTTFHFNLPR